ERQPVQLPLGILRPGLRLLDRVGKLLGLGEQRVLLLPFRPGDLLAQRLLLGPELLELREGRAPRLVSGKDLVDDGLALASSALRGTQPVGVLSDHTHVEHTASVSITRLGRRARISLAVRSRSPGGSMPQQACRPVEAWARLPNVIEPA